MQAWQDQVWPEMLFSFQFSHITNYFSWSASNMGDLGMCPFKLTFEAHFAKNFFSQLSSLRRMIILVDFSCLE